MIEDREGRTPWSGQGRARGALPVLMGGLFGALAVLLAFLAARDRRGGRRPRPARGSAAAGEGRAARSGGGPGLDGPGAAAPAGPGADVLEFFGDLRAGSPLDRWVLVEIGAGRDGAIPVRLADAAGKPFDLQVLRRDPEGPRAPAEEGEIAVYLVGVTGGSATPEEQGLGAMTLAAALADAGRPPPAWLRTMRQRPEGTVGPGGS